MLPSGGGGGGNSGWNSQAAPPPFTSPFDRNTGFYNANKPSAFQAAAFGQPADYAAHYSQPPTQSTMRLGSAAATSLPPPPLPLSLNPPPLQVAQQPWRQVNSPPPPPVLTDPFGNARRIAVHPSAESLEQTPSIDLEDEAPLLQELGIVPKDILRRMFCVLTFHNVGDELLKSMDMTGPALILMTLATSLLITSSGSRIQFGHVYAMMTAGTTTLWALLNMMASTQYMLSFHRALSVFGYGLLPLLIGSIVSPFVGKLKIYLIMGSVIWSTVTAGRFIDEALKMTNQRLLVAYPILLFYGCFALSLCD